jgi:hypothetical protein
MEHRITLSTDLLIAVRDKQAKEKERKNRSSEHRMTASGIGYELDRDEEGNADPYFRLYGLEHSKAV